MSKRKNRLFKGWIGVFHNGATVYSGTFAKTQRHCLNLIKEGSYLLTYPMKVNVRLFGPFPKDGAAVNPT